jgi:hypothetical protein
MTPHCASARFLVNVCRAIALLAILYFLASPVLADTIEIYDGATLTVEHVGTSRLFTSACGMIGGLEGCAFSLKSTNGATISSTISGGNPRVAIGDPGGVFVSDLLTLAGIKQGSGGFTGAAISQSDTGPRLLCGPLLPCTIIENGEIQTALTVNWSDGSKDTISFATGVVTPVPEPSSLLLSLVGLTLVGLWIHRAKG